MSEKPEKPPTPFPNRTLLPLVALAALVGVAALFAGRVPLGIDAPSPETGKERSAGHPSGVLDRLATGEMAAFEVRNTPRVVPEITFQNGEGQDMTLDAFKGKAVLLNLWATWCAPCREEMPALDRLQRDLGGEQFEVVALCIDASGAEAAKKMLADLKVENLKLYVDASAKASRPLGLVGMPTTLLIDAEGREVGRLAGPANWDSDQAKQLVSAVLPKSQ